MKKKHIIKTLQRSDDQFIQFTEEEMSELGISPGDKFSFKLHDGGVMLEKHVPVDIDLNDFDRDVLIFLIEQSIENQLPVDDVISEVLGEYLEIASEA